MTRRNSLTRSSRMLWRGLALIAPFVLALALPVLGQQLSLSQHVTNAFGAPGSNIARAIKSNSWLSFWFVIPFIALAEVLLVYVIFRFRRRAGDKRQPAKFHENRPLEFAWTLLPLIAVLAVEFMFHPVLKFIDFGPAADLNVMVVGHRFFWEYRYPAYGIDFANKALVVPAGRNISLDVTSVDVIHGFYVPSLGLQMDAVPGRVNHLWFNAQPGNYVGQCAQLCGPLHGEMMIDVNVVPPRQFDAWLRQHQAKPPATAAATPPPAPKIKRPKSAAAHATRPRPAKSAAASSARAAPRGVRSQEVL